MWLRCRRPPLVRVSADAPKASKLPSSGTMPLNPTAAPFNRKDGNRVPIHLFTADENKRSLLAVATNDGLQLQNVEGRGHCCFLALVESLTS